MSGFTLDGKIVKVCDNCNRVLMAEEMCNCYRKRNKRVISLDAYLMMQVHEMRSPRTFHTWITAKQSIDDLLTLNNVEVE